jgi:glycosyltransferase involved in cell wall biosynthesis
MGGAETSLRELLASVRRAAPELEMWLVLGEDGPLAGQARQLGVKVILLPFPEALARVGDSAKPAASLLASLLNAAWGIFTYRRKLARLLRSAKPDIIHTNGFKMHLLGAWTRPQESALIWHIHDYAQKRPLMSRLLRHSAKWCKVAIVNSRSVAADIGALLPRLRVVPIYNAVNLEQFSPAGSKLDLDAMAGLEPAASDTIRVGLVATFDCWKGHKVFLRALAQLPKEMRVRGYIIGGPIYKTAGSQWSMDDLQAEANALDLSGRVGFTGFLPDTAAVMRSLDIIVHASTEPEPFGMVIIEGMACGKPVIASRAGGASELFTDGENATGHVPGDAASLATQIQRLASDSPMRRRLGEAGRATAERLFSGERLAKEVLSVYEEARHIILIELGDEPCRSAQMTSEAYRIDS